MTRPPRTADEIDRFRLALAPIDHAFWASEQRWGVGRLERLQTSSTLAAYQRGWEAYRQALDDVDGPAIEALAPKMVAALAFMDNEATAAGHQPLDISSWEAPIGTDGTVLVLVRTQAEQAAVTRAANGNAANGLPGGAVDIDASTETKLPPDIAVAVRDQHEGRAIEVWTIGEVAALIEAFGSVARPARKWQGTPAHSGAQGREGDAADIVRNGYPLDKHLALDF